MKNKLSIALLCLIFAFSGCKKYNPTRAVPTSDVTAVRGEVYYVNTHNYPYISLDIGVEKRLSDGTYEMIHGLKKGNFSVAENGGPVVIENSTITVGQSFAGILVLDRSGSMWNMYDTVNNAVVAFINKLTGPSQVLSIINFGTVVNDPTPFTSDKDTLINYVNNSPQNMGGTSLWAATGKGLEKIQNAAYNLKMIIVMTDGYDNEIDTTYRTINDVISLAQSMQQPVYCIGYGSYDSNLFRLSQETGGEFYAPESIDQLLDIYVGIMRRVNAINLYYRTREKGSKSVDVYFNYGNFSAVFSGSYSS